MLTNGPSIHSNQQFPLPASAAATYARALENKNGPEVGWYQKLGDILPQLAKAFQVSAKDITIPTPFKELPLKGGAIDYIDIHPTSPLSVALCEALVKSAPKDRVWGFSFGSEADSESQLVIQPSIETGVFRLRGILSGDGEVLRAFGALTMRNLDWHSNEVGLDPIAASVDEIVGEERFKEALDKRDTDPRAALAAFDMRALLRYEDDSIRTGAAALLVQIAIRGKIQQEVMEKITNFNGVDRADRVEATDVQKLFDRQPNYGAKMYLLLSAMSREVNIDREDLGVAGAEVLLNISAKATPDIKERLLPIIHGMIEDEFKKNSDKNTLLGKTNCEWLKRVADWADGIPCGAKLLLDIEERSSPYGARYDRLYIVSNMRTCTPEDTQRILRYVHDTPDRFGPLGSSSKRVYSRQDETDLVRLNVIEPLFQRNLTSESVGLIRSIVNRDCFSKLAPKVEAVQILGIKYLFAISATDAEIEDAREKLLLIQAYEPKRRDEVLISCAQGFPKKVGTDFLLKHLSYAGIGRLMRLGDKDVAASAYQIVLTGLEEARNDLIGRGVMPWEEEKKAPRKLLADVYCSKAEFCEMLTGAVDSEHLTIAQKAVLVRAVTKVLKFKDNMWALDYEGTGYPNDPDFQVVKDALADAFVKIGAKPPREFRFLDPDGFNDPARAALEALVRETADLNEARFEQDSRWSRVSLLEGVDVDSTVLDSLRNQMEPLPAAILSRSVKQRNALEALYTDTAVSISWYNNKEWGTRDTRERVDKYGQLALETVKSLGIELSEPVKGANRPGCCYIQRGPEGSALGTFISETQRTLGMPVLLYMAPSADTNQVAYKRPKDGAVGTSLGMIVADQRVFAGSLAEIGHKFIPEIATAVLEQQRRSGENNPLSGYVDRRDKQNSITDGTRWLGAYLDDVVRDAVVLGVSRNRPQCINYCEEAIKRVQSFITHIKETCENRYELAVCRSSSTGSIDLLIVKPGALAQKEGAIFPDVSFPIETQGSEPYWMEVPASVLKHDKVSKGREDLMQDIQTSVQVKLERLNDALLKFRAIQQKLAANEEPLQIAALALSIPGALEVVRQNSVLFESLEALSGTTEANSGLKPQRK